MNMKKRMFLVLFVYAILPGSSVLAQHNELSFHFDPHLLSGTKLEVSSPLISETTQLAFMTGASFANFSEANLGLRVGLNFGLLRSEFTTSNKSYPRIWGQNIFYQSLSAEGIQRFNIGKGEFEILGGGDLRFFHNHGNSSRGFNALPTTPPSINYYQLIVPPLNSQFQPNIYGGISYIRHLKGTRRLTISLVKNFGLLKPVEGLVRAIEGSNVKFESKFSYITDYTGIRIQYGFDIRKKERPVAHPDGLIRQSIFVEALGSGGLYSINYDRRIRSGNEGLGLRLGLGAGTLYSDSRDNIKRYLTLPLMVNYIAGKGRSGIEGGIGITPGWALSEPVGDSRTSLWANLNLGYRFQPIRKGLLLRAIWSPMLNFNGGSDPSWAGVSLGYSFK